MSRPLALALYTAAMGALEPFAPVLLRRRARAGKEDPDRLAERLGRPSVARPDGPLVWLHGASVGESLSLLPLIRRIRERRPDLALLVTSGTTTSAALLSRRLPVGVIHQYAPVDGPRAAGRFLEHWRPGLVIFAESELWPNLILAAKSNGARLALVSARITEGSAKGWAKAPAAARALLKSFDLILPQDGASGRRLERLGGDVGPILNTKFAADPLPCEPGELDRMKALVGSRKVVLAASTHPGEEELIARAVGVISEVGEGPLLVVAPRHPERGDEVAKVLAFHGGGRKIARRSAQDPITPATAIYLADTLGEMGLLYRLADVAVMGGSFTGGVGGHNPLEPARLGVPVVTGPDIANFADVYAELFGRGALLAKTREELGSRICELLTDSLSLGEMARDYAELESRGAEAALQTLDPLLPA